MEPPPSESGTQTPDALPGEAVDAACESSRPQRGTIVHADNLEALARVADGSVPLVYLDPPFNTGTRQVRRNLRAVRDDASDRAGFGGASYRLEDRGEGPGYADAFDDYLGFLGPRLEEARRVLTEHGSLLVHVDPRESHYVKVFLDGLFGRDHFQNEIVWAYDYGARSKRRWSAKHQTILWYTRHRRHWTFRHDDVDRIPYMAPGLAGREKAARGKTPTDVWWHTIVSPTGAERTGYPSQKPLGVLERLLRVHSNPGDLVLDPFAGSGTTGEAAARLGRDFLLIDENPEAIAVMRERLAPYAPTVE